MEFVQHARLLQLVDLIQDDDVRVGVFAQALDELIFRRRLLWMSYVWSKPSSKQYRVLKWMWFSQQLTYWTSRSGTFSSRSGGWHSNVSSRYWGRPRAGAFRSSIHYCYLTSPN